MRLNWCVFISVVVLGACDKVPGTDANKIREAQEAATKDLIDPFSAQFRNVRVARGGVCGEVNAKNRMGAYVGFTRFVAIEGTNGEWLAQLDPQFDPTDLAQAEEFCSSVQSNPYSSGSLVQSACGRASEERLKKIGQELFNSSWTSSCEGK